jgi:rhodanese-related sulfurtransferase
MSAALGLVVNHFSPRRMALLPKAELAAPHVNAPSESAVPLPSGLTEISVAEARRALEEGTALFLDARSPDLFEEGHIPGAYNMPPDKFDDDFPSLADLIEAAGTIVVYCDSPSCSDSIQVAERLLEYGFENTRVLTASWEGWLESNGPVESEEGP